MRKIFGISVLLILAMFGSSCNIDETEYEKQVKIDDAAILAYLKENQEDAERSMTGVYFKALDTNPFGEAVTVNSVVSIIYTMRLLSGSLIEEHYEIYNPVKFSYSDNALLPIGLYEIARMRFGETYRFYIPSYLGFSNQALNGLFETHSNFIIDVTIVDLNTEELQIEDEIFQIENYLANNGITGIEKRPSGLFYIPTLEGSGENPKAFSQVKIHFTRSYLDGTLVRSTLNGQPLVVPLGQNNLISGLEEGIKLMKKGGKATIIVPSVIGFGRSVQVIPLKLREDWVEKKLIPESLPFSILIHEVELVDFIL
jgi:FKBP-type peptidyl-prolyl cis-trans isomerase FkpA